MKKFILTLIATTISIQLLATPDFSKFPNHVCEYLTANYDNAVQVEQDSGVPIAVTLGISCFESGYGLSYSAKKRNNLFGISKSRFKSKKSCFVYFGKLMNSERYKSVLSIPKYQIDTWVCKIAKLGYNSHTNYAERVIKVINYINKYKQLG